MSSIVTHFFTDIWQDLLSLNNNQMHSPSPHQPQKESAITKGKQVSAIPVAFSTLHRSKACNGSLQIGPSS